MRPRPWQLAALVAVLVAALAAAAGHLPGHYAYGMHGTVRVSGR